MYEFTIAGDNFSLTVRLFAYEFPNITAGEDADWVTGEVELRAGTDGVFTAKRQVAVFTPDLVAFLRQTEDLLKVLSGEAKLVHLEEEFGCQITLDAGRGHLSGFIQEHIGARLEVDEVKTDQSYLQATVSQLRDAVAALPPRGA